METMEDGGESDLVLATASATASVVSSSAETGVGGCSSLIGSSSAITGISRGLSDVVVSKGVSPGVGGSSPPMSCTTIALASSFANTTCSGISSF